MEVKKRLQWSNSTYSCSLLLHTYNFTLFKFQLFRFLPYISDSVSIMKAKE